MTGQVLYAKVENFSEALLDDGDVLVAIALWIGAHGNAADAFRRFASGVVADEKLGVVWCGGSGVTDQPAGITPAVCDVNAAWGHLHECGSQYK